MYNRVIIAGNLTKEPDLRYTASGAAVVNMDIAVNDKEKIGGEWKDTVEYAHIVVWGKQAESCAQYLDKGRQVLVEGKMKTRSWESDGQKRYKTEIVASTVKFLGSKGGKKDTPAPDEETGIEPF